MELFPELLCLFWQGQGSWLQAVSRQHYIFLPHNYCSFDFPCADRVLLQYQVPSAFTNQGLLYVAMIFVSCGGGPVRKRAVFFSVGKIPL